MIATILARSGLALMLATAVVAAPGPAVVAQGQGIAPDLARILDDPVVVDEMIEVDISFRSSIGFRADRPFVRSLYENPEDTVGHRAYPALLTPQEAQEFDRRQALEQDAKVIERFYERNGDRSHEFGGLFIDHERGGVLAVRLRDGAPSPWMPDIRQVDAIDIRPTSVSLSRLEQDLAGILDAVTQRSADEVTDAWIDVRSGRIIVGVTASTFRADGTLPGWLEELAAPPHVAVRIHEPRDEATIIIGGHGYRKSATTGDADCSFGFRTDRSPGKWSLTAGHCINDRWGPSDQDARIYKNAQGVGNLRAFQFADQEPGDYGRIEIDNDETVPGKIVHAGYRLAVAGHSSYCVVGLIVFLTGKNGGTTSGDIDKCTYTSRYTKQNIPESQYLVRVTQMVRYVVHRGPTQPGGWPAPGDSGGPIYTVNLQNGTVIARGVQGSRGQNWEEGVRLWYGAYTRLSTLPSGYGDPLENADRCMINPPQWVQIDFCPAD